MGKDKLEDYIQEHKAAFDTEEPRANLWDDITASMDAEKKESKTTVIRPWYRNPMIAVAAGVALLMATLVLLQDGEVRPKDELAHTGVDEASTFDLADISPEYAEVDHYYLTEINHKMESLDRLTVDKDLLDELELLREEYEALKSEMGHTADPELIVEAMIENYRLRLTLLEELLRAFRAEEELNDANNEI